MLIESVLECFVVAVICFKTILKAGIRFVSHYLAKLYVINPRPKLTCIDLSFPLLFFFLFVNSRLTMGACYFA